MSVAYKDIDELTQKSSLAGTEKIPISDTEFITPGEIINSMSISSLEFVDVVEDGFFIIDMMLNVGLGIQ